MNLKTSSEIAFEICQLVPDQPVLAGVSGGPDSLCLLAVLVQLKLPVIVAHFDHQLRPESAQDAERVRQVAEQFSLPFVLGSQAVAAYAEEGHFSLEEAARLLRYRFLFEQARLHQAQAVAVGHTADDQVETVLMHLLRGAGLNGLKGMSFRSVLPDWDPAIPLVRPLLSTWRAETLACCQQANLHPIFDASNQDTIFFRNRVRHELVPLLETLNPKVRENLWRTAQLLSADDDVVQSATQTAWEKCQARAEQGAVSLSLAALQSLPLGLQRGVLRSAMAHLLPTLPDVDFAAIDRAVRFIQAPHPGQIDLVHGLRALIENDRLWIAGAQALPINSEWPQLSQDEVCMPIPGEVDLGSGWRLSSYWIEADSLPDFASVPHTGWEAWLGAENLPDGLCLRRPRPGDRFQPLGMAGHSLKLSDYWINQKLPRRARSAWPLLAASETIVWVPGFRPAHPFRVVSETRRILHLRLWRE